MKKAKTSMLAGLSKPAKIAIIATAIVLLAAIVFGIVWGCIDHSFRYDRADLSQFYANGQIPSYAGIENLALTWETDVTADKVFSQINTNIKTTVDANGNVFKTKNTNIRGAYDTVYIYYEIATIPADGSQEEPVVILKNLAFQDESAATVARLGSGALNKTIEKWLLTYKEIGTEVKRLATEDEITGSENYTRVLDVEITYLNNEGSSTPYLTLKDHHYQPVAAPSGYYNGVDYVLKAKTDSEAGTPTQSTVTQMDADLPELVKTMADGLTTIGDSATATFDGHIDASANVYPVTYKVTLKSAFLAEQKYGELDFAAETDSELKSITYKDESNTTKTIDTGKLSLKLTVESVATLNKALVEEMAGDKITPPDTTGKTPEEIDDLYAATYEAYIRQDLLNQARDKAKAATTYADSLKSLLWKEIYAQYATATYLPLPADNRFVKKEAASVRSTHRKVYESYYYFTVLYSTFEEYVFEYVANDKTALSLSAEEQAKKLDAVFVGEAQEGMREMIVLFSIARERGITISKAEIRDYKNKQYAAEYKSAYDQYKKQDATMTEGELKVLADDAAKSALKGYTNNYCRQVLTLEKVLANLVPDAQAYTNITFTTAAENSAS